MFLGTYLAVPLNDRGDCLITDGNIGRYRDDPDKFCSVGSGVGTMLRSFLQEHQSAIIERWLADTRATYRSTVGEFLQRTQDPFANPVGNALTKGITGIFECLCANKPIENARGSLDEIVKIRAVQDFSPPQALSFIFLLKQAVRKELGGKIDNPELFADLAAFESRIDQVGLLAFDIYVNCRERVYQLRVDELKRSVSTMMRLSTHEIKPDAASGPPGDENEL
jgi:hypothetical protein